MGSRASGLRLAGLVTVWIGKDTCSALQVKHPPAGLAPCGDADADGKRGRCRLSPSRLSALSATLSKHLWTNPAPMTASHCCPGPDQVLLVPVLPTNYPRWPRSPWRGAALISASFFPWDAARRRAGGGQEGNAAPRRILEAHLQPTAM
eukprot:3146145-Rhodomonas_salina.1